MTNMAKPRYTTHYTEAGLIKRLEEMGIGRPSTFHTIVETIKERGYVTSGNIEGTPYNATTYSITTPATSPTVKTAERMMGQEKNKLIITDLGINTIQFLTSHFDAIFEYNYTAEMEDLLDKIATTSTTTPLTASADTGGITPHTICDDCATEIKKCISNINIPPFTFIENGEPYEIYYSLKGPLIRHCVTKTICNIKNGVTIEDIVAETVKGDVMNVPLLGEYEGKPVYAKTGKYGPYIQWDGRNIAVKTVDGVKLEDVIPILRPDGVGNVSLLPENKKVLRHITREISVRKGKMGKPYVYYKTADMEEPEFITLKGNKVWKTCSIEEFMEWFATVKCV
jgi:DNA topoisomerase-1